jgi:hypothetical protein
MKVDYCLIAGVLVDFPSSIYGLSTVLAAFQDGS